MGRGPLPPVLLVTDRHRTRWADAAGAVMAAVAGGIRFVQVRERDLPEEEVRALLRRLRDGTPADTRFVVNGHPAIALEEAVGLHLPAGSTARVPAGIELLGRSAHDEGEARRAVDEGTDYLLLGTIFPTGSKPGRPGAGVGLVERVEERVRPVPVYGIGGIGLKEAAAVVLRSGAQGVAVCSAVLTSDDPRGAAEDLVAAVASARLERGRVLR